VDLGSGLAVGAEALVRWRHPERGIVPPIEFIEIAEETGLIGRLGEYVLTEACRQFVQWGGELGAQAPQLLSVNLSRAQLFEGDIAAQVAAALHRSGLPPQQLQLEVTESLAAQDDRIQARLHELKALGLSLALDDFGTGYSSLASLHQLPVDVVKIDRSFVSQSESSAHHRVLIEATLKVARSLGMRTVAEGIETPGQSAILQALHCDKGQGYYYARPMPAEDAARWFLAHVPAPLQEAEDAACPAWSI
ncbi:EAL domain-containing protein, partial [uncultured Aquincola sp.]|uniref:putative bifunctional diguanylate cyclase/phosphodiesterase n=1 Tax=uncultured Aquincola sp. TaxID=886556 RepID=UPI0032B2797F